MMCLEILEKFKTTGVGWKLVWKRNGKYHPPLQTLADAYKKTGWNIDTSNKELCYNIKGTSEYSYPTGYHIFVNKINARNYKAKRDEIVKKVKYRKVVAKGIQSITRLKGKDVKSVDAKVVVAKEFKFIKV